MKYKAKKTKRKGQQLRSKLEGYAWDRLTAAKIPFEYEPWSITTMEGFDLDGIVVYERWGKKFRQANKVQPITYTPDFVGHRWIIETKGYLSPQARLRWKLVQQWANQQRKKWWLFMPHTQKEVDKCIKIIKENRLWV